MVMRIHNPEYNRSHKLWYIYDIEPAVDLEEVLKSVRPGNDIDLGQTESGTNCGATVSNNFRIDICSDQEYKAYGAKNSNWRTLICIRE